MCVIWKDGLMTASREEKLMEFFEETLPAHYNTTEIRSNQVQMAVNIATFLHPSQSKKILLLEAPVGTGKSLGALVPSLLECSMDRVFSTKRVGYATATINLQGQLMTNEVPLLKENDLLKRAILAKGKAQYYCHKEMHNAKALLKDVDVIDSLTSFYNEGITGQRDEYERQYGDISNPIWDKVNLKATKRECEKCNYSLQCSSFQHRNRFLLDQNELVITNHEQLIRSVLNRLNEQQHPPIIPVDPGIIIIDEAHHFLENFLSQLEEGVSIRDLRSIGRNNRIPQKFKKHLLQLIQNFELKMVKESEKCESLQGRYPLPDFVYDDLDKIYGILTEVLHQIVIKNINSLYRDDDFSERIEQIMSIIENIENDRTHTSWVTYENLTVATIPVNFPTRFKEMMDYLASKNKIIVMSGTLTTNGEFSSLISQWRLSKGLIETNRITESFQYDKQALIYVPENVKDPRRQENEEWINDQILHYKTMLQLTQGRTLLLSTSKQHMQNVSLALQSICEEIGVKFLIQEQGGVEQLTKQFKEDETSVLLGSGSYFSGFSVPGTSLVSVIFSRLPFPVPDDPYLKLIGAGLEDEFMEAVTLPHMLVKLNQGAGRLIRDINDYGIITILDPRLFELEYGELVRNDFEKKGYRFTRSLEEVQAFYRDKLEHGSGASYAPYSRANIVIPDILKTAAVNHQKVVVKEKAIRPKTHKITKEQNEFALQICRDRKTTLSSKPKTGEALYKYLFNLYFVTYKDSTPVRDHFPFINDVQREELITYKGEGTRTYEAIKCTHPAFGCTGKCYAESKNELENWIKTCGGILDYTFKGKGFCWLNIKPYDRNEEILNLSIMKKEAAAAKEDK